MMNLVVFDLGETLINYIGVPLDWSSHYDAALRHVFKKLSIGYKESMLFAATEVLNKYNTRKNARVEEVTAEQIFREIAHNLILDPEDISQILKEFFGYFQRKSEIENTALELLNFLKSNKINTAVLTDVPYGMPKELVVKDLDKLLHYIDLVVTSGEVGFRKPSTVGLKKLIKYFNTNEQYTIYVGNEKKDIDMANESGVTAVLLNPRGDAPEWGQYKTIEKLIEIKLILN